MISIFDVAKCIMVVSRQLLNKRLDTLNDKALGLLITNAFLRDALWDKLKRVSSHTALF